MINQSGKLDVRQPICLDQANGVLVVIVNQDDAAAVNGMILISPDQHWTFDVKAIGIEISNAPASSHLDISSLSNLAENQLQISSKHSVFNRVVRVQVV